MSRMQNLASRPKRTLGALAVVLAAVGLTVGSGASFSASKANAGTFAAGKLSIGNQSDKSIFSSTNMAPGDTDTGTVDVTNTGSLNGNFFLSQAIGAARPGHPEDTALISKLQLVVTDCGDATGTPDCANPVGGGPVYSGSLTGFSSQRALKNLGSVQAKWADGESHHFKFDITFPEAGGAWGSDDAAQGGQVGVTYTWKAVS